MDNTFLAERLAALGHVTRLRVVMELLKVPNGMPAGKLAKFLNVRQNSLSPHLASLARCSLISGSRTGREIIYAARHADLNRLLRQLSASFALPPEEEAQG
jgi:ArsR family transcriptional regulator, arsenate/arsenite/antimonite-responsive transcriptional repressor